MKVSMDKLLFSYIPRYLTNVNNLLSSSKRLGCNRKYKITTKRNIYFRHCVLKRVSRRGNIFWYKYGKFHRTTISPKTNYTLPAIIKYGVKKWYKNGVLHRHENHHFRDALMPAVIYNNGVDGAKWYYEGKFGGEDDIYFV